MKGKEREGRGEAVPLRFVSEPREMAEELEGARRALAAAELARATLLARLGAELGEPLELLLARLEALESEKEEASWRDRLREARRVIPELLARIDELAGAAGAAEGERPGGRRAAAEQGSGARPALPASARAAPEARPHDSPRILAVDDNLVNLQVLREQLERRGLQAVLAASGEEAWRRLQEESFDLSLMDSRMPGLDGLAVTRLRRQMEKAEGRPRLAIIAFTANAGPGDREACLSAGMDDYLTKPLRPAELDRVLAFWLPGPAEESGVTLDAHFLATLDDPNDDAFLAELVELFLADCPPRLQALADAAAAGDRVAAEEAAHSLKGSAANLGAVALSRLTQRVCDRALSGSADLRELSRGVAHEYARAAAALRCAVAGRT